MNITANTIDELWIKVLDYLLIRGDQAAPRGLKTQEVRGATRTQTDPDANILINPVRKINYTFSVAEWLHQVQGRNDVSSLAYFNPRMPEWSDDGEFFAGAYGPKIVEQLPYVLECLRSDPFSRQALIVIWRERPRASKDVPCSTLFQFFIRDEKLHCVSYTRSNDAWLGFPYDVFNFTQLQRYIAALLGIKVGRYVHQVGSLHLYEEHFDLVPGVAQWYYRYFSYTKQLRSPDMPSGPPDHFKPVLDAASVGMAFKHKEDAMLDAVMCNTCCEGGFFGEPWDTYARVLYYRTHKNRSLLPHPYREIYALRT